MPRENKLKIALCHLNVVRGDPALNLEQALELGHQAGGSGARVMVFPELAISGYGFDSRAEIAPYVMAAGDPRLAPFARLCREHGSYLALGLAEYEPAGGLYYNGVFMWGPDGRLRARRRKVTAESKWAAPGRSRQPESVCDTPWGRLGLLVCSESYFGLLPRGLALAGVDLLLLPANWPPGGLDPCELWRIRAMENGLHLAACNRAGEDRRLDCSRAESAVFDPRGDCLARSQGPESHLVLVDVPLLQGCLDGYSRRDRLRGRSPGSYAYAGHDLRGIKDLTSFLDLPKPGALPLWAVSPEASAMESQAGLASWLRQAGIAAGTLVLLPSMEGPFAEPEALCRLSRDLGLNLAARLPEESLALAEAGGRLWRFPCRVSPGDEPRLVDLPPARLGLATADELIHPEAALVLAKRGCDLALVSSGSLPECYLDCLAARSLDNLAVAAAGPWGGLFAEPPQGHQRWKESRVEEGGCLGAVLETESLRSKNFLERVDLDLVLAEPRSLEERGDVHPA